MAHGSVLLVNCPNRLTRPPEFFPYGPALISAALKKEHIDVSIYDLNLNRDVEQFFTFLRSGGKWDIIALSGIITSYSFQKMLAAGVKEIFPSTLVVSGGGLASSGPDIVLESTKIDVCCIGEGEDIMVDICRSWRDSRTLAGIPGIYWKEGDLVVKNPPREAVSHLDSIPFPDWEGALFPVYLEKHPTFYNKGINSRSLMRRRGDLTTTRGCPHRCSFCANVFNRQSIRARSVENVIEEILLLKKNYDIDSIDFLDEQFCFSRQRVLDICDAILVNDLEIQWGTAARVDSVDEDLLKAMKEAGCTFILYGFESGSQTILDNMGKGFSIEDSWDVFRITEDLGINAMGNLIIGHPGETADTMNESLEFQKKRYQYLEKLLKNRNIDQKEIDDELRRRFETVSFVIPFPGTRLFEDHIDKIGDVESFLHRISMKDAKKLHVNLSHLTSIQLLGYQQLLSQSDYWWCFD